MIVGIKVLKNGVDKNEKEFQLKNWEQHITNDLLEITNNYDLATTYYILDSNFHTFTPYGYVRETKNYYIKANYSNYTHINKNTLKITVDDHERE